MSNNAAAPGGAQMQPKWVLQRHSRVQVGVSEELEKQKQAMEKQLRDRAQRLSRISMRLQTSGGGNLNNKLKEFEVQQMAAQLAELHDTMKSDEQQRRDAERSAKQREDEQRALAARTQQLEQMYKSMDPKATLDAKAAKRRTALLGMKATGAFSDAELMAMEAKEKAQEDQELARERVKQEATERKLREMEDQVKNKERDREAERLKRQQEQLRLMESKMASLEKSLESGTGDEFEVGSEADLQREIERRQREAKERRERERKERERVLLEEERIRRERDEALFKKKMDMERRMREMEQLLAEKQREKEEAALRKKQERLVEMERQLKELDKAAGVDDDEYSRTLTDVEARKWQQKAQLLEDQLKTGGGGVNVAAANILQQQQQALSQREKELDARAKQMEEMMAKLNKLDQLEGLVAQLARLAAGGFAMSGGGMGGGGGGANTVEDLKKTIEEQQKILFDPNSTPKQIEDANIKLEKAMQEYEKTGEYQTELARQKAERRAKHEGPNREALKKLKQIYNPANVKSNPELLAKIGDNPELRLLFMEHDTIMKLHVSDFKAFSLRGLALEEMRAIRACLPPWRKDQKVQTDWTNGLDDKIDELSNGEGKPLDKPIAPRSGKPLKLPKVKAGAGTGDLFAEIQARGGKVGKGGGGGGGRGGGDAPGPALKALPTKLPPLPKMGALPPPGPPGAASSPAAAAAPAAAAPAGPPPAAAVAQYKTVKTCLEKLLKGLVGGTASEKEIATDTRVTVQEIKALAKIQKAKYPDVCGECEDSASELVVAVKAVLVAKKAGGADLNSAKQKLAQVIDQVRNLSIKTLGPNGRDYIK